MALPMPPGCGQWFVTGSFQYLDLVANNLQVLNEGRRHEFIGKVGVGFSY